MAEHSAVANSGQSLAKSVLTVGQLVRVLQEGGLSNACLKGPIDNPAGRRELIQAWTKIFPAQGGDSSMGCTLAEAEQIMGANFHGPAKAKEFFGGRWAADAWKRVPFSPLELAERKLDHVLVAVRAMSLADVYRSHPEIFSKSNIQFNRTEPWYCDKGMTFAQRPCQPGWYLLRKQAVPKSRDVRLQDQLLLVREPDFVPEANLCVYASALHYLSSSELMYYPIAVNTSSVNENRNKYDSDVPMAVGGTDNGKLALSLSQTRHDEYTGIASALALS